VSELKLLVVEDDDSVRAFLTRILLKEGYSVLGVRTLTEAQEALDRSGKFDVVIADWRLPDGKGYELAARVGADRMLMTSGFPVEELIMGGVPSNQEFIPKPFNPNELLESVRWIAAKLA
jgi:DNA-binding response OmpR family regulator